VPGDPTRRRVLVVSARTALGAAAAAGLAGAAGCGRILPWSVPPDLAPDVGVLTQAIAAEHAMISRYQSVVSGFPSLGPAITPVLRQHEQHLAALRGRLVVPAGARTSSSPSHSARGAASSPPALPTPAAAFGYLRAAEEDAATALVRLLPLATPSLAQLLASIGASEASHVVVLRPARRPGPGRPG
jgi:hypothetical protein